MPARRLMRTAFCGSGWRSIPLGAVSFYSLSDCASSGWWLDLLFVSTADLHFLSLLARSEHEVRAIKETVHDIGLILHAVVRHLAFAVFAHDQQHRGFPMLKLRRHLNVGLRAVVEHTDGPDVLVAAADLCNRNSSVRR